MLRFLKHLSFGRFRNVLSAALIICQTCYNVSGCIVSTSQDLSWSVASVLFVSFMSLILQVWWVWSLTVSWSCGILFGIFTFVVLWNKTLQLNNRCKHCWLCTSTPGTRNREEHSVVVAAVCGRLEAKRQKRANCGSCKYINTSAGWLLHSRLITNTNQKKRKKEAKPHCETSGQMWSADSRSTFLLHRNASCVFIV